MIQNLFLIYANHSLKEEPTKLKDVFDEFRSIENIFFDHTTSKHFEKILSYFPDIVKKDDFTDASARAFLSDGDISEKDFKIVFESIYGYRDGYCSSGCRCSKERRSVILDEKFSGPNRLKCFECDQVFFRHILTEIVSGREYLEIGPNMALERLLNHAYQHYQNVVVATPGSQSLEEMTFFFPGALYSKTVNYKEMFSELFFKSIVAYSLTGFLLHNDRLKLKRCKKCKKFFVAKKADKRTERCPVCSKKTPNAEGEKNPLSKGVSRKRES